MSIVNNLLKATNNMTKSDANVKINLGNGHSNITVTAANADIDTGCGDQTISVVTSGDLKIDTGHCGYDSINAIAGGNVKISTYEDDDDITLVTAGNFDIDAGEDTHECEDNGATWTDNDTVKVISTKTDGQNYVKLGKGDDNATVIAHYTNVQKDEGTMVLGSMGDNLTVDSDATINIVGYWGSGAKMNFYQKESYNDVRTMDYWIEDGSDGKHVVNTDGSSGDKSLKDMTEIRVNKADDVMTLKEYDDKYNAEYVNYFKDNFSDFMNTATYQGTDEVVTSHTELIDTDIKETSNKDELIKKFNLSAEEQAILNKIDLSKNWTDGQALYGIAKSPQKSKKAGKDVYVIVKRDGANHARAVSNNECIAYTPGTKAQVNTTKTTTETWKTTVNTLLRDVFYTGGLKDVEINQHKGQLNAFLTVDDGQATINKCDNTNNCQIDNIRIEGGKIYTIDGETTTEEITKKVKIEENQGSIFTGNNTYNSPLILDMDGDGKVSAAARFGVDVSGNKVEDGTATGGDKMLAFSDISGDGKVGGQEVFGDKTVSPFTKKAINAKNGFEALKIVAQQAKQYTGIDCMDGNDVDVLKLQQALNKVGVTLGFVAGANTTKLETLQGVAKINVGNYTESNETGNVQHRQQGTFTTTGGETRKVDDVWFKS